MWINPIFSKTQQRKLDRYFSMDYKFHKIIDKNGINVKKGAVISRTLKSVINSDKRKIFHSYIKNTND